MAQPSDEVAALREQVETLRQQLSDYIEAQSALTDSERKHDAADLPRLGDRIASLEQQLATVAKAVNSLTVRP
jgi:hypothetical protein